MFEWQVDQATESISEQSGACIFGVLVRGRGILWRPTLFERRAAVVGACMRLRLWHTVAPLIGLCDLFTGIGSGIVYKSMPLFLLSELQVPPITVQLLIVANAAIATLFGLTSPPVQHRLGPMGTAVLYRALAVSCLGAVTFSSQRILLALAIAACVVMCGGFMNAVGGFTEVALIDHTSTRHRGKWQIVQPISDST
jgi:hypothetical protein